MTEKEAHVYSLVQECGLKALIVCLQDQGYMFDWYCSKESHVVPSERKINISLDQVRELSLPELEAFTTVLAHELGHVKAAELDLDYADEDLAWQLAEDICPKPLPKSWDEVKDVSVRSHVWSKNATELTMLIARKFGETHSCTTCGAISDALLSHDHHYDKNMFDRIVACTMCDIQFRARYKNGEVFRMWQLADSDYERTIPERNAQRVD